MSASYNRLALSFCARACGRLLTDDLGRLTDRAWVGPFTAAFVREGIELRALYCVECAPRVFGDAAIFRVVDG